MSDEDLEYLPQYHTNTLYTHPALRGAYATLVAENEIVLAEIEITARSRIAVSAFYVNERGDYGTFKIVKIIFHKTRGWREDGCVIANHFELSHMKQFISILATLDLRDAQKARIGLDDVQIQSLATLLNSSQGKHLLNELSQTPELHSDIYAVAAKRTALDEFESNIESNISEHEWQNFFELNTWIFGHGLNYVFLDKVSKKLETVTTGFAFDQSGKRSDALMRTRAEVSQYVLIEIKRHNTELVQSDSYRSGCWAVSSELSAAVTQTQKTVFDFTRGRFRDRQKNQNGDDLPVDLYAVDPRSYLIVGDLKQILENEDKIACFELYRRNLRAPEILTFDELFQRARCIVETISHTERS